MPFYVYIVKCKDNTLYTGYTVNLEKRITTHNTAKTAAKYTKARRPVTLIYHEIFPTKSEAMKREVVIKKLTHKEKSALIAQSITQRD